MICWPKTKNRLNTLSPTRLAIVILKHRNSTLKNKLKEKFAKQKRRPTSLQMNTSNQNKLETATLAGGCFWCTEAIFKRLKVSNQQNLGILAATFPILRTKSLL